MHRLYDIQAFAPGRAWSPWPRPGMQCLAILIDINRYYISCNICQGARARAGFVATWTVTKNLLMGCCHFLFLSARIFYWQGKRFFI